MVKLGGCRSVTRGQQRLGQKPSLAIRTAAPTAAAVWQYNFIFRHGHDQDRSRGLESVGPTLHFPNKRCLEKAFSPAKGTGHKGHFKAAALRKENQQSSPDPATRR